MFTGSIGRRCPKPRGKGIGGTSLINGLTYARGHPRDFNKWANMGNKGWSYEEVLQYFKKSEDFNKNLPDVPVNYHYHGIGGNLPVEYSLPTNPFYDSFIEANIELGNRLTDYNTPSQIGVSPTQFNIRKGKRMDGGKTFIQPILTRENLKVMTKSFVIKIIINNNTKVVTGIQFTHDNRLFLARIRKEAILSAGSFNSPQLLMLSGIGPKTHLKKHGIDVIENLEVGTSLRDHTMFRGLYFSTNISNQIISKREYVEQFLNGYGPLTMRDPNTALGFMQSSLEKIPDYPDIELIMSAPNASFRDSGRLFKFDQYIYDSIWGDSDKTSGFEISVINLHEESVGSVRLKSSSPYDFPIIDSNLLSDPQEHDISVIHEGINYVMRLIQTKPFQRINARLQMKPLKQCESNKIWSKDYWFCVIRFLSFDVAHPIGTCPMGPDRKNGAVVNNKLQVYGMKNLRIADASVFPLAFSGHPNAPCVMVGEVVSDIIKRSYDTPSPDKTEL